MKKILLIVGLIGVLSCNYEIGSDCFQATGNIIEQEYEVDEFKHIEIYNRVRLIISQGETQKIVIQTGENLINEVFVRVEDSILKVSDRNSCNFVRDYDVTKVFVTVPDLKTIINKSGVEVRGEGEIAFDELTLVSDDPTGVGEYNINGDFIFDNLKVNSLIVKANGLSKFFLKGKVFSATFTVSDSDVRIEAGDLEANGIFVFHRSTNKIIVNPLESLRGQIVGIGDVISKNRPPIVEVEEFYTGKLIFED